MERSFARCVGLLLLGLLCVVGCVRQSREASAEQIEAARARIAAHGSQGDPAKAPWSSVGGSLEVFAEAVLECSGVLWKEQFVYARSYLTREGTEGPIDTRGHDLSVWIYQDSGLFEGVSAPSIVPDGKYAEVILVLEGNLWTDPCGCITVTGQRDSQFAGTIMSKRVLCPEGYSYRWDED